MDSQLDGRFQQPLARRLHERGSRNSSAWRTRSREPSSRSKRLSMLPSVEVGRTSGNVIRIKLWKAHEQDGSEGLQRSKFEAQGTGKDNDMQREKVEGA